MSSHFDGAEVAALAMVLEAPLPPKSNTCTPLMKPSRAAAAGSRIAMPRGTGSDG